MANKGFVVPRPSDCPECKGGRNGMDVCEKCGATGTVFKVGTKLFPDTKDGYVQAERALNGSLSLQSLVPSVDEIEIQKLPPEEGLEFQPLETRDVNAKYLETREFQDKEIAKGIELVHIIKAIGSRDRKWGWPIVSKDYVAELIESLRPKHA